MHHINLKQKVLKTCMSLKCIFLLQDMLYMYSEVLRTWNFEFSESGNKWDNTKLSPHLLNLCTHILVIFLLLMLIFGFQLVKLDDAGRGMPGRFVLQGIILVTQYSVTEARHGVSRWYSLLVTKSHTVKPIAVLVPGFGYLNEHLSVRVKSSLRVPSPDSAFWGVFPHELPITKRLTLNYLKTVVTF